MSPQADQPSPDPRRLVLASNNAGKIREFAALLEPLGIELVTQGELGVGEIDEPFSTFIENALHKARHAARMSGCRALADDSGLCVPALGGAPGVFSARYAQDSETGRSDAANNARLLKELQGRADRSAYFYCVLVMVRSADDPQPVIAEGRWDGQVLEAPRGANGFGYDPLFFDPTLGRSAAELEAASKNMHSHRARALRQLVERLTPRADQ